MKDGFPPRKQPFSPFPAPPSRVNREGMPEKIYGMPEEKERNEEHERKYKDENGIRP